MAQKNSTVNFLIHDANGQPQMIKVLQSAKPVPQIQLSPSTMKTVFKVPGTPEGSQQGTIYRTVNVGGIKSNSKLIQVPVQTLTQYKKTAEGSASASQQNKVQNQSGMSGVKVIQTVPNLVHSPRNQTNVPSSPNSKTNISPIPISRKRQDSENEPLPDYTSKRRKVADKIGKGLRHFSMKVCEKVRNKGFTSYNEVADELVVEFTSGMHGAGSDTQYDQKNIRRRVYDALNVLMAMNIISKEKKEIRWLGLPTNSVQECHTLQREKQAKLERIQQKTQQLHDLILQQISLKSLVERNRAAESRGVRPSPSSAIHLPFIVVNTSDKATIDCSISNDKMQYLFNFNKRFQIYDDIDILKRMGLLLGLDKGECSEEDLIKAKSMVPKSLDYYVEQLGRGTGFKLSDALDEESDESEGEVGEEGEEEEEAEEYSDDEAASSSDVDVN